jgi:uncharacterized phage-like protein YoqJ
VEFTESRWNTVCFTGHRPEKLTLAEDQVRGALRKGIDKALEWKYTTFISGMAPGVDIWAAEEILALKKGHPEIKLICAIPYDGFDRNWNTEWKEKFDAVKSQADEAYFICPKSMRAAPIIRDKWMVDHSSLVIAVYTGGKGGTRTTIEYAEKQKIKVLNILKE